MLASCQTKKGGRRRGRTSGRHQEQAVGQVREEKTGITQVPNVLSLAINSWRVSTFSGRCQVSSTLALALAPAFQSNKPLKLKIHWTDDARRGPRSELQGARGVILVHLLHSILRLSRVIFSA